MRYKRQVLIAAAVLVGVAIVCALIFYLRPVSAFTQLIRFRLLREGASSRYARVTTGSGRFRIHYYVAGDGPPVVLIHGIGGSGENWAGIIPPIRNGGFRVYALDLLGFGRSDRPDVDYSIALQAEVVHAFLAEKGIHEASVGGVSMGGWVALQLAAKYPSQVTRLLLIDTAGTTFAPTFSPALFEPHTVGELQLLLNKLMPHAPKLPDYIGRDLLRSETPGGWVIGRAMRSMFSKRDLLDAQLRDFAMPTLILWGREDQVIPLRTGELLHEQIKNSELKTFAGCGHLLLEVCGERIVQPTMQFLSGGRPVAP